MDDKKGFWATFAKIMWAIGAACAAIAFLDRNKRDDHGHWW